MENDANTNKSVQAPCKPFGNNVWGRKSGALSARKCLRQSNCFIYINCRIKKTLFRAFIVDVYFTNIYALCIIQILLICKGIYYGCIATTVEASLLNPDSLALLPLGNTSRKPPGSGASRYSPISSGDEYDPLEKVCVCCPRRRHGRKQA